MMIFEPSELSILGKWEMYAKSNRFGDLEITEENLTTVLEFYKDDTMTLTKYYGTQQYPYRSDQIIQHKKICNSEWFENYGIKELNEDELVLYNIENPFLEYYFKKI